MGSSRFSSFTLTEGESDLWIGWNATERIDPLLLSSRAREKLIDLRTSLTSWAQERPDFLSSLEPLPLSLQAPPLVSSMLRAGASAGVGPMAAVAGAIAEYLGRALMEEFPFAEVVVENGGDLWLYIEKPLTVAVYAGLSSLSGKIGVTIGEELSPCGLACSSGTVGPSLSFGKADAALILDTDAARSDAWATALGNAIKYRGDLAGAVERMTEPLGALAILGDTLAARGKIRLAPLAPSS